MALAEWAASWDTQIKHYYNIKHRAYFQWTGTEQQKYKKSDIMVVCQGVLSGGMPSKHKQTKTNTTFIDWIPDLRDHSIRFILPFIP